MKLKTKIFVIFLLCTIKFVYADGAFDSIVNSFAGVTSNWQAKLLPVAKYIFWFLASIEFAYQLSVKKLLPNELSKLWVWLVVRFLTAVLFAQFVLDPDFYIAIVSFFIKMGTKVGGAQIDPSASGSQMYSPSALFLQEWLFFWPTLTALFTLTATANYINSSLSNFFLTMALSVIVAMLILVITVMLTLIEAYFVLFAGIILCGFAGSSWTLNFWQKYLSYVGGVAMRLFCTSLLLGMFSTQWNNTSSWLQPLPTTPKEWVLFPVTIVQNLVALMGVFFFDMVLMVTLPSKAAAMLNGAVNAGFGEAIAAASLAMSGGRMLGGGAGGVVNAGGKVLSGAMNAPAAAKSAAFKAMRTAAKNNIGNDGGGNDDKWKQMLRTTGRNAANDASKTSIQDGVSAGKKTFADAARKSSDSARAFSQKAGSVGSGGAGGSSLNIDPHKHN